MSTPTHLPHASRSSLDKDPVGDVAYTEEIAQDNGPKLDARMTPAERRKLLKAALEVDPGVKPWSWRAIQTILIVLVTCCCKSGVYCPIVNVLLTCFRLG